MDKVQTMKMARLLHCMNAKLYSERNEVEITEIRTNVCTLHKLARKMQSNKLLIIGRKQQNRKLEKTYRDPKTSNGYDGCVNRDDEARKEIWESVNIPCFGQSSNLWNNVVENIEIDEIRINRGSIMQVKERRKRVKAPSKYRV